MSKKIAKELSTEHSTLNPELWNGTVLKSDVRKKLLEIAIAFKEFLKVNVNVVDCVIVGSAANYNWSEHSDIDLHLIVRSSASEVERELYDSKKLLWSNTHEIEINGFPVECYVETEDVRSVSGGVYSVVKNKWLRKPTTSTVEISVQKIESVARELDLLIKKAVDSNNLERLKRTKTYIFKKRKQQIRKHGERSVYNLAFKFLRRTGSIEKMLTRIHELETQSLSL